MSTAAFASQRRVEYSSIGLVQVDPLTPLDESDFDKSFRGDEITAPRIVKATERFLTCSGEALDSKVTTTRMVSFQVTLRPTPQQLAWLYAMAFGNASAAAASGGTRVHTITRLTPSQREMPKTSMRFGYLNGVSQGKVYRAVVEDTLEVGLTRGPNSVLVAKAGFLAAADHTPGSSTTYKPCYKGPGISRKSGDFLLASVSHQTELARVLFSHSNGILRNEDPYTLGVDVQRWRRAAFRPYAWQVGLDGVPESSNTLYAAAVANEGVGTRMAAAWHAGAPGNRVSLFGADAYVSTQDDEEGSSGEGGETTVEYDIECRGDDEDPTFPYYVTATLPTTDQPSAFLQTPA